jgi:hypothetical protein
MCEGVAQSDAWGSGLDEFVGVLRLEHAGLGGHGWGSFYMAAGNKKVES